MAEDLEDRMEQKIKYMDWDEFLSGGFLQEANRAFFHPLGLALEVNVDDEGKCLGVSSIWDYRDDPEGMRYGWELEDEAALAVTCAKASNVYAQWHDKAESRKRLLGYVIQPLPDQPQPPKKEKKKGGINASPRE